VPVGVKENGAIFSHPNPWAIIAECILGRGDRAFELYNAIAPHRQNDKIEVREAEPYSYCQFVVGRDHPSFGRARHPWLTGTCGWFYTAATRYMLGFKPDYDGFTVDPCVPKAWRSLSFERKFRGALYKIEISNPEGMEKGVKEAKLNGKIVRFPVKPQKKGSVNQLSIVMGTPPAREEPKVRRKK
jgi:N,N'-diacetylchitobiose phosphorylase